ncbi:sphingoid long-chain base transporter rsb1 [Chaetomidium leptoderma]|uniref:Sphingoid long-chain base transporter rsb1 n=1 Tax=Chaetomidium leptoderma TaxID=669021 RepID=A0AAN6ZRW9_9PEZI|nr:sphingoid long-chain base transporter rsb1 [Chaetomidium leptoderma]
MSSTPLPPGVPRPPQNVVFFGPKANCTLDICPVQYSVYGYRPSLAANVAFIALNAVAALVHTYLGFRWKQWWFMGCMIVGAVNSIIGYVGRVMMYYNPFNFSAFMLQIICITTGPVYYCAAIYITLALSIKYLSPELSRFRPQLFYYIFIPCDIVSLVLQAAGGGLSTSSSGQSQIGVSLALAGMSFQVFTIVLFCAFFADYLIRYFRSGPNEATRWKLFFGFMALAVLLTLVRCSYRLAELHEGYSGGLVREEGLFIALEGGMVLAAAYCLMIGHPGLVFKPQPKDRASGESESPMQELQDYPH